MKIFLSVLCMCIAISAAAQSPSPKTYRNDIAVTAGTPIAETNAVQESRYGLQYRRNLTQRVWAKATFRHNNFSVFSSLQRNIPLFVSDSMRIERNENLSVSTNFSLGFGADIDIFKYFSLGANFTLGSATGEYYSEDWAYLFDPGFNGWIPCAGCILDYHNTSNPGFTTQGSNSPASELIETHKYFTYGGSLNITGKLPITKRFEIALSYEPEVTWFQFQEGTSDAIPGTFGSLSATQHSMDIYFRLRI